MCLRAKHRPRERRVVLRSRLRDRVSSQLKQRADDLRVTDPACVGKQGSGRAPADVPEETRAEQVDDQPELPAKRREHQHLLLVVV